MPHTGHRPRQWDEDSNLNALNVRVRATRQHYRWMRWIGGCEKLAEELAVGDGAQARPLGQADDAAAAADDTAV